MPRVWESLAAMPEDRPVVFDRKQALARLGGLEELLMDVFTGDANRKSEGSLLRSTWPSHVVMPPNSSVAAHTLMARPVWREHGDLVARLRRVEELADTSDFDAIANELPEIDRQFNA